MKEEDLKNLIQEFVEFTEKHRPLIPCEEFGYAVMRMTTAMMYKVAPTEQVAARTIQVSIQDGYKLYQESVERNKNKEILTKPI